MESSSRRHQNQRWIQTQHQQQQQQQQQNPKQHHQSPSAADVTVTSSSNQHRKSNDDEQQQHEEERESSVLLYSSIVGTCPSMCPVEERLQRERLRDLSVFERLNGSPVKTSPNLAVKKFCRTISTKHVQASDVRPLHVLEETLNYLLNFLDSNEYPFEVVHDFIFDRTRSIRQDLSMQSVINDQVIQMFEKMVKFHVISHHKLRRSEKDSNAASSMHYLNMEQLTKTLTSLFNLYEASRNSKFVYDNEAEFRSLYVLLHLGHDRKPMGESLSLWFRHASPFTFKLKEMVFARKILRLYNLGNYKRFISITAADASYMQYCIIEPFISEVRALAICCVNYGGYKLHPYPVADLSKFLMMEESDVESFCKECGLKTTIDEFGKKILPTKQTSFCHPKGGLRSYNLAGFEILVE